MTRYRCIGSRGCGAIVEPGPSVSLGDALLAHLTTSEVHAEQPPALAASGVALLRIGEQ